MGSSLEDGNTPTKDLIDEPVTTNVPTWLTEISDFIAHWGVETRGIDPILPEDRKETKMYQMFLVWFSACINIVSFGTGSSGPAFFGLGLRDSLVIILVADLISSAIPAYLAVFGPKLGMRSMILARYSWGYYGFLVPSILNVFSQLGFLVLNCMIGGQTLSSVSSHLDDTLGIVIIGVISLAVTFFGYRVIHWYESVAWIPCIVVYIAMLATGGKHLGSHVPPSQPASATSIMTFGTTVASSVLSWDVNTPDYGVYHTSKASSTWVFLCSYSGFLIGSLISNMLGAAFAAAAPAIPAWNAGFDNGNSVGGLVQAILSPAGGFGQFLMVIIALFVPSSCVPTIYTLASSFMTIHPSLIRVPRYVYAVIAVAIGLPIAIVAAKDFYATWVDVISIVGYWTALFGAIVIVEHVVFRKNDWGRYDLLQWSNPTKLPPGFAAVFAFLCAAGIVIPCMSQAWYEGPIAKAGTGDIGIIVGFAVAAICYPVYRTVERAFCGR